MGAIVGCCFLDFYCVGYRWRFVDFVGDFSVFWDFVMPHYAFFFLGCLACMVRFLIWLQLWLVCFVLVCYIWVLWFCLLCLSGYFMLVGLLGHCVVFVLRAFSFLFVIDLGLLILCVCLGFDLLYLYCYCFGFWFCIGLWVCVCVRFDFYYSWSLVYGDFGRCVCF